mmetsp:Transcript_1114/g.2212  ORF Transcript_1114/g.2212 Transcript_1114/m.2212 type:complete len:344 (-) Transcript_1114:3754-4785(-)
MAVSRFGIASNKKSALLKQNMREVAVLLAEDPPKEEKARIKAEALIRDDYMIEAYDILSLNCDLLSERMKLISYSKQCPPDLVSCVSTLIYAAPRIDIPELVIIRKQFRAKYGKKFEEDALNNANNVLNERVVTKLSVQPPAAYLVQTYLETICEKYEVDWSPTVRLKPEQIGEPMAPPKGFSVEAGRGTGLGPVIATTGTTVVEEDITMASSAEYNPHAKPSGEYIPEYNPSVKPSGEYIPPIAPSSVVESSKIDPNDFVEPDIFIPAAPGSTPSNDFVSPPSNDFVSPPSAPSAPPTNGSSTNGKGNDKDDDENGGTQASSDGKGSTYDDLAARFDNLKNL